MKPSTLATMVAVPLIAMTSPAQAQQPTEPVQSVVQLDGGLYTAQGVKPMVGITAKRSGLEAGLDVIPGLPADKDGILGVNARAGVRIIEGSEGDFTIGYGVGIVSENQQTKPMHGPYVSARVKKFGFAIQPLYDGSGPIAGGMMRFSYTPGNR